MRILKIFFLIFTKTFGKILFYYRQFFNFIYPNLISISKNRIRITKFPICNQITYINGLGTVEVGERCFFGSRLGGFHRGGSIELQARYKNSKIIIGKNLWTNNNIFLCAANYIEVGDNTLIGQYVTIMDHEAHGIAPLRRREVGVIGKVVLGKNVWIGNNVTILKNSEIGDNSIVAAGAIVSGVFPSNCIIGGVPAKLIKTL